MDDNLLGKDNQKNVISYLNKEVGKFDIVILIDYGHGFLNKKIYEVIRKKG